MYSFSTINQLQSDLKSGLVTGKTLVEQAVSEIKKKKQLNAFLEVFEKTALENAFSIF